MKYSEDEEPIHLWFNLTYASYLVLPRSALQSMPLDWQREFVDCLQELESAIDFPRLPGTYIVLLRDESTGKMMSPQKYDPLLEYERGRRRLPWTHSYRQLQAEKLIIAREVRKQIKASAEQLAHDEKALKELVDQFVNFQNDKPMAPIETRESKHHMRAWLDRLKSAWLAQHPTANLKEMGEMYSACEAIESFIGFAHIECPKTDLADAEPLIRAALHPEWPEERYQNNDLTRAAKELRDKKGAPK